MDVRFASAWRSVGDVSRVTVEFPDGTSMKRTLGGNICTWVTDGDGRVIDLIPGVMDVESYRARLTAALGFAAVLEGMAEAERPDARRSRWSEESSGWVQFLTGLKGGPTPALELPTREAILSDPAPFPSETQVAVVDDFDVSISKSLGIEDPIVRIVGQARPDDLTEPLEIDSWLAVHQLRPQALALLVCAGEPAVDDVSRAVFRRVLRVDPRASHEDIRPALLGRRDGFLPVGFSER